MGQEESHVERKEWRGTQSSDSLPLEAISPDELFAFVGVGLPAMMLFLVFDVLPDDFNLRLTYGGGIVLVGPLEFYLGYIVCIDPVRRLTF